MSRRSQMRVLSGRASSPSGASGSRGLVSSAVAAAGSWLLEPADPALQPVVAAPPPLRPVVAVFGLARGCGVTVVARALAVELASRDPEEAAAVHCDARATGIPLATHAAAQLARALAEVPGADTRAVGRLCLVGGSEPTALAETARHLAPLVLDAGSTSLGGVPAALADQVVLVVTSSTEPALVNVAADCLARLGHEPRVVLNRAGSEEPSDEGATSGWTYDAAAPSADPDVPGTSGMGARRSASENDRRDSGLARAALRLPDSRMGAQLALGGREPRGGLGRAIAQLADLCEGGR